MPALLILALLLVLIGFGVDRVETDSFFTKKLGFVIQRNGTDGLSHPNRSSIHHERNASHSADLDFYRSVVKRVSAGESFYRVLASELRSRHYPSGSPFAWRSPAHLWTLATISPLIARITLIGLTILGIILAYSVLRTEPRWIAIPSTLFVTAAVVPGCSEPYLFLADTWCGLFLFIAAMLIARDKFALAALFGILALLMREHAMLAVIMALVFCAHRRQWRALAYWLIGLTLWAIYYAVHIYHVLGHIGPNDLTRQSGWLQFEGWRFVLATAQMYPLFNHAAPWVCAVVFPVGVVGLIGWKKPPLLFDRAVALGYIAAFLVLGYHPMNFYWGLIYLPLWSLGIPAGVAAMADLVRASAASSNVGDP